MEYPVESSNTSPVEGINKTLNELSITRGETQRKRKPSRPSKSLSIQPTPFMTLQSPVFSPRALATPLNNERSYLLENRQRQHERGERLADALHIIEVQITSVTSKGEIRKLRKEAGLLEKKIAESLRQEQLITLRLNEIQNEELGHNPFWQPQSAGWIPYATPWSPTTLPMMSPLHGPVSPLTPLPPGLYHPSPTVPSPLTSPYWLGVQYQYQHQAMAPFVQADRAYYVGMEFQQPHMPEMVIAGQPSRRQSMAPTAANPREFRHKANKSVDFKLPQGGAYKGRRWSLADTFSPRPKDKRMSIPGLETIWKDNKEKED